MQDARDTGRTTAAGVMLERLGALGVDYIFANSGTDFPPIIEALADAQARQAPLPKALVIPHEHAAMGMAHGYYLATGRAQAVMAHTNVGLANCTIGAINAAAERVPVLMFSGRTPVTEQGRFGSRTVPIAWGQEMRDQAALIREACKWDYELRFPEQMPEILDRAAAIAMSTPRGPVYLSLPREVLCEPCPREGLERPVTMQAARVAPDADAIGRAAKVLAAAERPVIFAQHGAGSPEGFERLARLADAWGIPVVQYWAVQLAIATDHPMYAGVDPQPFLAEADAVLVLDSLAPWSPDIHRHPEECVVIQAGPDPLSARFPVRNFRSDISIAGETDAVLAALSAALEPHEAAHRSRNATRYAAISARNRERRKATIAAIESDPRLTKARVSRALSEVIGDNDAVVLSELGAPLDPLDLRRANSWYQEPHSGGLGWSFACGLGMSLADPDRLVIATMGDGSYIFSNPAACHQIAEALHLPLVVVIVNNAEWAAVRHAVTGLYPKGEAVRANRMPLTSLAPQPDFTKIAEASRAWAKRVESVDTLVPALREAIAHVREKRTLALVDVRVEG